MKYYIKKIGLSFMWAVAALLVGTVGIAVADHIDNVVKEL